MLLIRTLSSIRYGSLEQYTTFWLRAYCSLTSSFSGQLFLAIKGMQTILAKLLFAGLKIEPILNLTGDMDKKIMYPKV